MIMIILDDNDNYDDDNYDIDDNIHSHRHPEPR